jgi:hypothetical protein
LVAAGVGGFGPGILATVLGLAVSFGFVAHFPELPLPQIVDAAVFVAIGAGAAWGGEQLQRNRLRASATNGLCVRIVEPPEDGRRHRRTPTVPQPTGVSIPSVRVRSAPRLRFGCVQGRGRRGLVARLGWGIGLNAAR